MNTETDPLGHDWAEVPAVDPTCTEPGREAGVVCSRCGAVQDGCAEIPATGHTPVAVEAVPATEEEPGHEAGVVCSICGAVLDGCEEIEMQPENETNSLKSNRGGQYPAITINGIPHFGQRFNYTIPLEINPHNVTIDVSVNGASMDCGIACLAMIEGYYHHYPDEDTRAYHYVFAARNSQYDWANLYEDPVNTTVQPFPIAGYDYTYSASPEDIYASISNGVPVMVHRTGSWEHWVVVYGYDGSSSNLQWGSFMTLSPSWADFRVSVEHLYDLVDSFDTLNCFMFRNGGVSMPDGSYVPPAPVLDDGDYIIAALSDRNYYLDIDGGGMAENGTNVQLYYTSTGNVASQDAWTVTYNGNGYYRIKQCGGSVSLDVEAESGVNVQVWASNSTDNQQWAISGSSSAGYIVRSRYNGKYLEYNNSALESGTNVQVATAAEVPGQYWLFIPYSSTPITPTVTFEPWEQEDYTYIGDTDAAIGNYVTVTNGTCTEVGMVLYTSGGTRLGSASNEGYTHPKNYFKINEEMGITLTPNTTYKYRFYAIVNGETYWSSYSTFTTLGCSHMLALVAAQASTCATKGHTAFYCCTVCGAMFADAVGTTIITDASLPLNPDNHESLATIARMEPTCVTTGHVEYQYCSACGKYYTMSGEQTTPSALVIPVTDHIWGEWATTYIDPTYARPNIRERTCINCGTKETQQYYNVYYSLDGGTGGPETQIKIIDVPLTLSSIVPTHADDVVTNVVTLNPNGGSVSPGSLQSVCRTSYSFNCWELRTGAIMVGSWPAEGTCQPGDTYTKNATAWLSALWNTSTARESVNLPTPTREGYTFKGWARSSDATSGVTGSYTPTKNVTLYAIWEAKSYLVRFDANGGTGAPDSQYKVHDVPLTLSSIVPTRADETVTATVTLDPNGGSVSPDSLSSLQTTTYRFSRWSALVYSPDYSMGWGGSFYDPGDTYTYNGPAVLTAVWSTEVSAQAVDLPTPTRKGYTFKGWGTSPDAESGITGSCTPIRDVTLYAIWEANTYTIHYNANGGTGAPEPQTKVHDVPLTLSDKVPTRADETVTYIVTLDPNGGSVRPTSLRSEKKTSYSFLSWTVAYYYGGIRVYDPYPVYPGATYTRNADATLYAQWDTSITEQCVNLPTPVREGYTFKGWGTSIDAESGITGSYAPEQSETLYALWEPTIFTITYDANGGTGAPEPQTKEYGKALTLSSVIPTRGNDVFLGWATNSAAVTAQYRPGSDYTEESSATLYAVWKSRTSTVTYDANGGTGAPEPQVKYWGQPLTLSNTKPTREGYVFWHWYQRSGQFHIVYQPGDVLTQEGDITLIAEWRKLPANFALNQEYLAIPLTGTEQLTLKDLPQEWESYLTWASDNESVATVSPSGMVTPVAAGTAWITASLDTGDGVLTARCRVDVVEGSNTEPISDTVSNVRLLDTKATVELYKTEYARIRVVPEFNQNQSYTASTPPEVAVVPGPAAEYGVAIDEAWLVDAKPDAKSQPAEAVFSLGVADDRTLEITPRPDAVLGNIAVKSSYKAVVCVRIGEETFQAGTLTISLKKTLPKLTAKAVKLDSLFADEQDVIFSGSVPAEIEVTDWPQALQWLEEPIPQGGSLKLKIDYEHYAGVKKNAAKLSLKVRPEGWAVKIPLTVSVSAAPSKAKLSFKPSSLSLQPGKGDYAETAAVVTPAALSGEELQVVSITEGSTVYPNNKVLLVEAANGTVTVSEGKTPKRDGRAHTFKVTLGIQHGDDVIAKTVLTVKLLAAGNPLTVKASGFIDTGLAQSPITLKVTPKNVNPEIVRVTGVSVSSVAGKAAPVDVSDRFDAEIDGMIVTLRKLDSAVLESGRTYTATVHTSIGDAPPVNLTVRFTAAGSLKSSVTLKATGYIDVIRPDSAAIITPTIKNCYTHKQLSADDLVFCWGNDPDAVLGYNDRFNVEVVGNSFKITLNPEAQFDPLHPNERLSVYMQLNDGTKSANLLIPVKMGTAKIAQSAKSVTMLATDANDRAVIKLTPAAGLSEIRDVVIVSPKDRNRREVFDLVPLGNGEYAICYNGNELPAAGFKSGKVTLQVFLKGNLSTKANATISVTVKLV